ncbi:hypothetical protein J5J86_18510 [Aquabacter sp. L1I39]|uniref:hypothetical protein n=1 Tax=Aquabacter sp. L1I39 TaxID=2820278 RepID=UPI001ADD5AAB|nr:hypothetical protein [Aquabacter sp. L1I39]QTL02750.1 hypothetical protein J5J86_18510 [Aquabacter sp. L1I39]
MGMTIEFLLILALITCIYLIYCYYAAAEISAYKIATDPKNQNKWEISHLLLGQIAASIIGGTISILLLISQMDQQRLEDEKKEMSKLVNNAKVVTYSNYLSINHVLRLLREQEFYNACRSTTGQLNEKGFPIPNHRDEDQIYLPLIIVIEPTFPELWRPIDFIKQNPALFPQLNDRIVSHLIISSQSPSIMIDNFKNYKKTMLALMSAYFSTSSPQSENEYFTFSSPKLPELCIQYMNYFGDQMRQIMNLATADTLVCLIIEEIKGTIDVKISRSEIEIFSEVYIDITMERVAEISYSIDGLSDEDSEKLFFSERHTRCFEYLDRFTKFFNKRAISSGALDRGRSTQ